MKTDNFNFKGLILMTRNGPNIANSFLLLYNQNIYSQKVTEELNPYLKKIENSM